VFDPPHSRCARVCTSPASMDRPGNTLLDSASKYGAVKLIFIYGPPAVGKLTVARKLARMTGYKLYHNHVSIDFVKSVFEFGTPTFWRLVDKFRREMLEEAAKEGIDVIFTFVYDRGSDDEFVNDVVRRVKSQGGMVCFVRLYCDPQELARRVNAKSRKKLGKLVTKSELARMVKKFNLASEVPIAGSLSLDTGSLSAEQAATAIAARFRLPRT